GGAGGGRRVGGGGGGAARRGGGARRPPPRHNVEVDREAARFGMAGRHRAGVRPPLVGGGDRLDPLGALPPGLALALLGRDERASRARERVGAREALALRGERVESLVESREQVAQLAVVLGQQCELLPDLPD